MTRTFEGLVKLERRRKHGYLWKWKRAGYSHEVTLASRDSRRRLQDAIDAHNKRAR